MHRASKRSNRNSRTVHKAADQMPSRPLAIPAIHMATPTAIRMDIRTVIRMVTTRIAIATTVASGSRCPFKLVESWLAQRAKNAIRGVYGVLGVMAIVLGIALLIWPGVTLKIAAVALGAYFVISGVIRIVTAIVELGLPGGWRVLDILVGLLLTVGGVVMLKNATLSGAMLAVLVTMVVGLGWMMEGVMALVESWHMPSSAWAVIYALISIVAGCIMLFSPLASTGWLILFGGCALVALGIVAIVRAFTFGKVGKKG